MVKKAIESISRSARLDSLFSKSAKFGIGIGTVMFLIAIILWKWGYRMSSQEPRSGLIRSVKSMAALYAFAGVLYLFIGIYVTYYLPTVINDVPPTILADQR
jgi:membrane protease YdiL (CAAX protease family)